MSSEDLTEKDIGTTFLGQVSRVIHKDNDGFGFIDFNKDAESCSMYFNSKAMADNLSFHDLHCGQSVLFEADYDGQKRPLARNVRCCSEPREGGNAATDTERSTNTAGNVSQEHELLTILDRKFNVELPELLEYLRRQRLTATQCKEIEKTIKNEHYSTAMNRMELIERMRLGDRVVKTGNADVSTFFTALREFTAVVPGWAITENNADISMFHLHYKDWRNDPTIMVIRMQKYSNCFMHAPVTLVHHKIAIATNGQCSDMANIGSMQRDLYKGDELFNLVMGFGGMGGSSLSLLTRLVTAPADALLATRDPIIGTMDFSVLSFIPPAMCESSLQYIRRQLSVQPGLISGMKVEARFQDPTDRTRSFSSIPDAFLASSSSTNFHPIVVTHSMVAIGSRMDTETGELFILCQNWCPGKYFVEFSVQYLLACGAQLTFLHKSVCQYSHHIPVDSGIYFETCAPDPDTSQLIP